MSDAVHLTTNMQLLRSELAEIIRDGVGESSAHGRLLDAARRALPHLAWAASLRPDFANDTNALRAAIAGAEAAYGN